jgi:hypothetical protein
MRGHSCDVRRRFNLWLNYSECGLSICWDDSLFVSPNVVVPVTIAVVEYLSKRDHIKNLLNMIYCGLKLFNSTSWHSQTPWWMISKILKVLRGMSRKYDKLSTFLHCFPQNCCRSVTCNMESSRG